MIRGVQQALSRWRPSFAATSARPRLRRRTFRSSRSADEQNRSSAWAVVGGGSSAGRPEDGRRTGHARAASGHARAAEVRNLAQISVQGWRSWRSTKSVALLAALALAVASAPPPRSTPSSNAVMLRPLPYTEGSRSSRVRSDSVDSGASRRSHRRTHGSTRAHHLVRRLRLFRDSGKNVMFAANPTTAAA